MSIFSDRSYLRSGPPFGKIDGGVHPVVSLGNSFSLPIWNSLDIQKMPKCPFGTLRELRLAAEFMPRSDMAAYLSNHKRSPKR